MVTFSIVVVIWFRVIVWVKVQVDVIAWSLGNNWASCLQKLIDWLICRLWLCCHKRFKRWLIAWWITVCIIDYETNCTTTVLHVKNNLTEAWRLLFATAELLFVFISNRTDCRKGNPLKEALYKPTILTMVYTNCKVDTLCQEILYVVFTVLIILLWDMRVVIAVLHGEA